MLPDKMRRRLTKERAQTEKFRGKDKAGASVVPAPGGLSDRVGFAWGAFCASGICQRTDLALSNQLSQAAGSVVPLLLFVGHLLPNHVVEVSSVYRTGNDEIHSAVGYSDQYCCKHSPGSYLGRFSAAITYGVTQQDVFAQAPVLS